MPVEVTTVSDDSIVVHVDGERRLFDGLAPDTEHVVDGIVVRTLPRPSGAHLATIATVNDLHLGETVCGRIGDGGPGPLLVAEPGDEPYAEMMSRAAAEEIDRIEADLVVAKGDLTDAGRADEFALFDEIWGSRFGERLVWIPGNHDTSGRRVVDPVEWRDLPGVRVVLVDTSRPGLSGGDLSADQVADIDAALAEADRPVMVMAHHPLFGPWMEPDHGPSFLLQAQATDQIREVARRRPGLVGWFAGHTHRNLVRPITDGSSAVAVEVASVKEFPGAWAEYRVFEGGIVQVVHRLSSPTALAWSERTRALFRGMFPAFAFGRLEDRCVSLPVGVTATSG